MNSVLSWGYVAVLLLPPVLAVLVAWLRPDPRMHRWEARRLWRYCLLGVLAGVVVYLLGWREIGVAVQWAAGIVGLLAWMDVHRWDRIDRGRY